MIVRFTLAGFLILAVPVSSITAQTLSVYSTTTGELLSNGPVHSHLYYPWGSLQSAKQLTQEESSAKVQAPAQKGHVLSRAERLASYMLAQIVETKSSLEIAVNSPRPLDDVLIALAKKYGWRINYEDPRYPHADLVDDTDPSWLERHPDEGHVHVVGGGAFRANISLRVGDRPDAQQVIAAVVRAYNNSGNPGRFELRASNNNDNWLDVVPTAAADGPQKPILDALVGFDATPSRITELSLDVFCDELTFRSRQPIKNWASAERGIVPEQAIQPHIELHDPDRPAREVLRHMLRDSLTTSWRIYYNSDTHEFRLLLRSDAW